jgi:hypothetical protein
MIDQDFVYGVFADYETAETVVAELHQSGLKTSDICVVGNKTEQFNYVSARIQDPTAKYFFRFGIGGCLVGAWAGIAGAPTIPYIVSFQILVPLMAAISGGVVFAYFGCWMCAFLYANKPHHWANAFEGTVESGNVIVLAEPSTVEQRHSALSILSAHEPLEMIVRRKAAGQLVPKDTLTAVPPFEPVKELALSNAA